MGAIVGLLLTGAALVATTACGAGFGPGTGGCRVTVDEPHESRGSPGFIVGKARITCDVPAENVHLYVVLQYGTDEAWSDLVQGDVPMIGAVEVGKRQTRQVAASCGQGTFRTAARGDGTLGGQPSASAAWTYSRPVTNPCAR